MNIKDNDIIQKEKKKQQRNRKEQAIKQKEKHKINKTHKKGRIKNGTIYQTYKSIRT